MTTLAVTARGQVTFRKEILNHLRIRPGDKVHIDFLPGGRAELSAEKRRGSVDSFFGSLKGKTNGARLTIEEIGEAIAAAGAAAGAGED